MMARSSANQNWSPYYLQVFDAEAAAAGATRGEGTDVKSAVRLVGPEHLLRGQSADWITPLVRNTCKLPPANSSVEIFCARVNGGEEEQFLQASEDAAKVQDAISTAEDAATELVLTRRCADVCKITHLLRVAGPAFSPASLQRFDNSVQSSLQRILGGPLDQDTLLQSSVGVHEGGLGLRLATDLALPAFIASRVERRPMVMKLAESSAE